MKNYGMLLLVGLLCVAGMGASAAPGGQRPGTLPGNLMSLTIQVRETMAGGPAMPARTIHKQVCMQAGQFDADAFAKAEAQGNCTVEHYRKNGAVVTFDVACTQPEPVTSHGVFHLTGGSDFAGTMHTAFTAAGHPITVDTNYTGKKTGSCSYQPPAGK